MNALKCKIPVLVLVEVLFSQIYSPFAKVFRPLRSSQLMMVIEDISAIDMKGKQIDDGNM